MEAPPPPRHQAPLLPSLVQQPHPNFPEGTQPARGRFGCAFHAGLRSRTRLCFQRIRRSTRLRLWRCLLQRRRACRERLALRRAAAPASEGPRLSSSGECKHRRTHSCWKFILKTDLLEFTERIAVRGGPPGVGVDFACACACVPAGERPMTLRSCSAGSCVNLAGLLWAGWSLCEELAVECSCSRRLRRSFLSRGVLESQDAASLSAASLCFGCLRRA